MKAARPGVFTIPGTASRITSYNVCYTKLLRFEIDVRGLSVKKEGTPIEMRKKLFDLFLYFVKNEETVLSNEALFSRAWEAAEEMNENSLYVHIRALRKLVEDDPAEPRYIRTVRNAGSYNFV